MPILEATVPSAEPILKCTLSAHLQSPSRGGIKLLAKQVMNGFGDADDSLGIRPDQSSQFLLDSRVLESLAHVHGHGRRDPPGLGDQFGPFGLFVSRPHRRVKDDDLRERLISPFDPP